MAMFNSELWKRSVSDVWSWKMMIQNGIFEWCNHMWTVIGNMWLKQEQKEFYQESYQMDFNKTRVWYEIYWKYCILIRRPRQTQGGARQGIRQASLAAPAARAAAVAAAACSSGRISELARPSEARCFPPAGDFFEAGKLQQPQATEAVEKGCFSRISDDTLGSFLAWFWN